MKAGAIFIWLFFWAAMLFSQADQSPNDAFKAGFSSYQEGNYDAAIKHFTQAINLDGNRNYFYYNRGMAYEALGKHALAATDFRRSLELKTTAEAHYQLGKLAYKQNNLSWAKTELEAAREIREDLENMNFYLGLIYFKDKEYSESYGALSAYLQNNKTNAEAYYFHGYCAAELGKQDEALRSLKFATVYNSKDWKYYLKMYDVYMVLHDNLNALNNISMVIELGEHKPEYYTNRAGLYRATGKDFLAEEDAKVAARLGESANISEQ